jgi:hypothetical protein
VLGFTALSSFAAGTATIGIFFVTERPPYAFTPLQQYALGLLVGVTYTLGALAASPLRRLLARRRRSARGLLALLSLAMAALLCLPLATSSAASIYALLALYAPLTGVFWPVVEAYVSGGRRAAGLRTAMGRFNVVWSATLLPSFLCIPPLMARSSVAVFVAIALTHALSVLLLPAFRREPGEHLDDGSEHAVPASYRELLRVHRVLHAMSYLVMYALSPYLPRLLARLGLVGLGASALGTTWLAARVLAFALLERWHGWHGRWSVAVMGTALVLVGFGAALLAPSLAAGGLVLVALALLAFGTGLAALYTAALYYALEVGGNEGGGSHEALIGLGYSLGPSCGLLVCALERWGVVARTERDGALLLVITSLCLGLAAWAWRRRHPRRLETSTRPMDSLGSYRPPESGRVAPKLHVVRIQRSADPEPLPDPPPLNSFERYLEQRLGVWTVHARRSGAARQGWEVEEHEVAPCAQPARSRATRRSVASAVETRSR